MDSDISDNIIIVIIMKMRSVDSDQQKIIEAAQKIGCCVRCRLRLAGLNSDDIVNQTVPSRNENDNDNGDIGDHEERVCIVCQGLLQECFVCPCLTNIANKLVMRGHYSVNNDKDNNELDKLDNNYNDMDTNDYDKKRKREQAMDGNKTTTTNKIGFSVEVHTFEALSVIMRQRAALGMIAKHITNNDTNDSNDCDDDSSIIDAVISMSSAVTEVKTVFKSIIIKRLPLLVNSVNDNDHDNATRVNITNKLVFDSFAPLTITVSLKNTNDSKQIHLLKGIYKAMERHNNNNNNNNNDNKKLNHANNTSSNLLPKKKRDSFMSHQRPSQSILNPVLDLIKPAKLIEVFINNDNNSYNNDNGNNDTSTASNDNKHINNTCNCSRGISCISKNSRFDIAITQRSVYCSGRYIKHQRGLSQSPWVLNGVIMGDGSVEECIAPLCCKMMKGDEYSFISSGREDIDVRMLGNGRPFAIEIKNPKRFLSLAPQSHNDANNSNTTTNNNNNDTNDSERRLAILNTTVERDINTHAQNNGKVIVKDLKFFCTTQELDVIKKAGEGKQKCYRALIWSSRKFTQHDYNHIKMLKDVKVVCVYFLLLDCM